MNMTMKQVQRISIIRKMATAFGALVFSCMLAAVLPLGSANALAHASDAYDVVVCYHDAEYNPMPSTEFVAYPCDRKSPNVYEPIAAGQSLIYRSVTDRDGRAVIKGLPSGSYVISGRILDPASTSLMPVDSYIEVPRDAELAPKSIVSGISDTADDDLEGQAAITETEPWHVGSPASIDMPMIPSPFEKAAGDMAPTGDPIGLIALILIWAIATACICILGRTNGFRRLRFCKRAGSDHGRDSL